MPRSPLSVLLGRPYMPRSPKPTLLPGGPHVRLRVYSMAGRELCCVSVPEATPLSDVTDMIERDAGVPAHEQRLIIGTSALPQASLFRGDDCRKARLVDFKGQFEAARFSEDSITLSLLRVSPPPRIYAFGGGCDLMEPGEVYDHAAGEWQTVKGARIERHGHAVAVCGDKIVLAGGASVIRLILRCVELFNISTKSWSKGTDMRSERYNFAAAGGDGHVVAAGGTNYDDLAMNSAELSAEGVAGAWRALPPMAMARQSHALVGLGQGKFCALGGLGENSRATASVELLDLASGRWSALPDMSAARHCLAAAALPSGAIVAVGGKDGEGRALNLVETLLPGALAWSRLPDLPVPRHSLAVVAVDGDTVCVLGGRDASHKALDGVDTLDTSPGGSWTRGARMRTARSCFAAAAL